MTNFRTQAIHAGYEPNDEHDHAAVPPIYASAAFNLGDALRGDALAAGELDGFEYSRVANPTVDALERRVAALEGGIGAVAVGSGMAAVTYALMCAGEGGGRIIAPTDLYGASVDALGDFLPQFGIHADFVKNINDLDEVESKIGPDTRAIFAETVANPSTEVLDIEPLAALAHKHGIAVIVDNTVPTPYLLRPIEFGADIVVHSTTKGITGHGNAIGGIIVDGGHFDWTNGRFPQFTMRQQVISDDRAGEWHSFGEKYGSAAFIKRIRIKYLRTFGAVQSPFNAYLSLVGLETLPQRVSQQVATATRIAEHLTHNPHVTKVNYSGLGTTPQYELVRKYFPNGVGQIMSFLVDGSPDNVRRIIDGTKLFSYVPNIGDARSLIVDPAHITHREVPAEARRAAGVTDNMLRLSIGLEDVDDLIADLDQAIAGAY
ncbi:bifunctional O-acetylhomoserine aminocarboxypropyltransferase/cysteine synthase [Bifidobacterium sp. SMB2]|uniref:Bifunctional O-acetylhomoserine aminocarboxypropyltransferase/cysteine synthase n=1 Tax=Bifidobacterium saimiriisciurei TaxID=2661627 RepID=A0ABX0C927_9BIFI|nr:MULTISPECIES: PLP-dependent transferase [Bifidobacterium]NEG95493.1 bifunctional O-acetylhomoserine aminocarboxypropyltransferase/cysteine synthase [Bifidobacterium sp. SMB2]NEH11651.1 bifunctional O-acetylhomoserine aminocarboxypropyltransferase/cysteine synthase [Bifidobacterium saimiriisciurei]